MRRFAVLLNFVVSSSSHLLGHLGFWTHIISIHIIWALEVKHIVLTWETTSEQKCLGTCVIMMNNVCLRYIPYTRLLFNSM